MQVPVWNASASGSCTSGTHIHGNTSASMRCNVPHAHGALAITSRAMYSRCNSQRQLHDLPTSNAVRKSCALHQARMFLKLTTTSLQSLHGHSQVRMQNMRSCSCSAENSYISNSSSTTAGSIGQSALFTIWQKLQRILTAASKAVLLGLACLLLHVLPGVRQAHAALHPHGMAVHSASLLVPHDRNLQQLQNPAQHSSSSSSGNRDAAVASSSSQNNNNQNFSSQALHSYQHRLHSYQPIAELAAVQQASIADSSMLQPLLAVADLPATGPPGSSSAGNTMPPGSMPATAVAAGMALLLPAEAVAMAVFKQAKPSVVNVSHSRSAHSFSSLDVFNMPHGQASGFIWDTRGHVVTCYHAVKGLAEVKVTLHDHSTYTAKVVGFDAAKDLAVLRLSMPKSRLRDLQPVTLGSSASLAVGQAIWGIGNPYGLDHTLTQGVVSGLGRQLPCSLHPIRNVIQTTAANAHQAGGVLQDSKGHVVGIIAANPDFASCPLGFAVPVDSARGLVEQVLLYGRPMRPTLGITYAPPQVLEQIGVEGVLVLEVPAGSPAAAAGLRPTHRDIFGDIILGDIIVGGEGRVVRGVGDLEGVLDDRRAGDRVKVDIIRDNKATSLTVVLGERGSNGFTEE